MIMWTSWSLEENHCCLMRNASCGILVAGHAAGTLEIAEGGTAARIEQRLDGGVGVLGRVMDLGDVVHRRDAAVELAPVRRRAR